MGEDDYSWLMGPDFGSVDYGQELGGNMDQAPFDFSANPNFGMNDRGLGTQDPNLALPGEGTLSPGAIGSIPSIAGANGMLATQNGSSLSGVGGTSAGGVSDFLKSIGGLPGLLSLLAPILGGVMASSASSSAAAQQQAAAQKANDQATALMGGSGAAYKPYQDAGGAALGKLQGMNWTPLSGQFADPHAASIAAQFQHNATPLAPTMSSPGMGRMATLASLGGR